MTKRQKEFYFEKRVSRNNKNVVGCHLKREDISSLGYI